MAFMILNHHNDKKIYNVVCTIYRASGKHLHLYAPLAKKIHKMCMPFPIIVLQMDNDDNSTKTYDSK